MKRVKVLSTAVLSIAVAAVVAGCHHPVSDAPVAVIADYSVIIDTPVVKIENGVTTISGTLHRVPGNGEAITGRLDIDFIAADGDVLDWLPCGFNPRKVPTDPNTVASYEIRYEYVPPKGTTVQVKFVDSAAAEREDADNTGPSGANGPSGARAGGHGGGHPNHYGGNGGGGGGGGFGSGFGTKSY